MRNWPDTPPQEPRYLPFQSFEHARIPVGHQEKLPEGLEGLPARLRERPQPPGNELLFNSVSTAYSRFLHWMNPFSSMPGLAIS